MLVKKKFCFGVGDAVKTSELVVLIWHRFIKVGIVGTAIEKANLCRGKDKLPHWRIAYLIIQTMIPANPLIKKRLPTRGDKFERAKKRVS